jgi:hypothetical protein
MLSRCPAPIRAITHCTRKADEAQSDQIEAITTSSFIQSLKKLTFGGNDYGRGSEISDEFIIEFKKAAP